MPNEEPNEILMEHSNLIVRATRTAAELDALIVAMKSINPVVEADDSIHAVKQTVDKASRLLDEIDRNLEVMRLIFERQVSGHEGMSTDASE